jgi:hypothetical protein
LNSLTFLGEPICVFSEAVVESDAEDFSLFGESIALFLALPVVV